jgi:hypothetical protein
MPRRANFRTIAYGNAEAQILVALRRRHGGTPPAFPSLDSNGVPSCRRKLGKGSVMRDLRKDELGQVSGGGDYCCYCPPPEENLKGNNGWGNGEDAAPGNSLANQPKFEDPNTGPSPSNSPASGGGDR